MFADTETTLNDIFAGEYRVVIRTIRGIYRRKQNRIPKPGEQFAMGAIAIYRFVDGKIVDDWGIQVSCPADTDMPWG